MTKPSNLVQFSLLAVLSVLGSAVNLATVLALLRDARLRGRATSVFLVNLSIADLAFSLFNGPLDAAVFYHGGWTHSRAMCIAAALVRHVAVGSSLASIQLITLNRYTSVVKPRVYAHFFSPGSCLVLAALCWLLPAGLMVPAALGVMGARLAWDEALDSCTVCGPVYRPVLYLGSALLPLLLFAACYPKLFMALRHSRRRLTSHMGTLQAAFDLEARGIWTSRWLLVTSFYYSSMVHVGASVLDQRPGPEPRTDAACARQLAVRGARPRAPAAGGAGRHLVRLLRLLPAAAGQRGREPDAAAGGARPLLCRALPQPARVRGHEQRLPKGLRLHPLLQQQGAGRGLTLTYSARERRRRTPEVHQRRVEGICSGESGYVVLSWGQQKLNR